MVAVVAVSLALAACGNAAGGQDAADPGADAAADGKTNVGILLLDGKNATTFHTDTADLQSRTPQCTVVNGERIVVDGNLITSAGGLASYEAALYVVEKDQRLKPSLGVTLRVTARLPSQAPGAWGVGFRLESGNEPA